MSKSFSLLFVFSFLFLAQLQAQGFQWLKQMGGTGFDAGKAIALDASGNVFTTGYFSNTVDFDPNAGVQNLTSAGEADIFIQKLDAAGNLLWAKRIGSTGNDWTMGAATDQAGSIYVTGFFKYTVDFDPGPGVFTLSSPNGSGNLDYFIMKLDASGNFRWAKDIFIGGYSSVDTLIPVKTDNLGNVYVAYGTVNGNQMFLKKFDTAGNEKWSKSIGSYGVGSSHFVQWPGLAVDNNNNLYVSGMFEGQMDCDLGPGYNLVTATGVFDGFILKLDTAAGFVWCKDFACTGGNVVAGIRKLHVDHAGNIYAAGLFNGLIDLDPGPGVNNVSSGFGSSPWVDLLFLVKLDAQGNHKWGAGYGEAVVFTNFEDISSDTLGNVYVTGTNGSNSTNFNPLGFPSVTGNPQLFDAFQVKIGPTGLLKYLYHFGGPGYDNGYGIAVNNAGDVYSTGSFMMTANFGAGGTLTGAGAEDVFVHKFSKCGPLDTSLTRVGNTLTAHETNSTFQWVNCTNMLPVAGASGSSFTPTVSGSYAVIITKDGCADTSGCRLVSLGIEDGSLQSACNIFPNPSDGSFSIDLGKTYTHVVVEIKTVEGAVVSTNTYPKSHKIACNLNGPAGLYFVHVNADGGQADYKLMKK